MYKILKHRYTHVAIGLNENDFYSFCFKGFSKEKKRSKMPQNWRDNYAYCYIDVDKQQYNLIKQEIYLILENERDYRYSIIEFIGAFLKIPIRINNHYFCSYFVADVLKNAGYSLQKKSNLYLPNTLAKELQGNQFVEYTV